MGAMSKLDQLLVTMTDEAMLQRKLIKVLKLDQKAHRARLKTLEQQMRGQVEINQNLLRLAEIHREKRQQMEERMNNLEDNLNAAMGLL
jgi:hypothetical protein